MTSASQQKAPQRLRVLISDSIRIWGGAQRFVIETAVGLRDRGHEIVIQTQPGSPLAIRAADAGIEVMEVSNRVDAAPWTVLPLAWKMRRRPFDIVMTTFDKDLRTSGLAARLSRSGAVVIHTRECDDPVKNKARYRWFYTRVADHIIVNSEATLATTLESAPWLDRARTSIVYKGIDLADYESTDPGPWRARANPHGAKVVIGYAGQLIGRKRLDVVLRLLARPPLASLPWHVAVAGTGPDEQLLRDLAKELGIEDRVTFLGFVDEVQQFYKAIDILVLPSFIEGFGYVLAEAGAAGKPSVAYRASSVPEVVIEGETALLADPANDDEFAAALQRLIEDDALRMRMGQAARKDVFARHGLDGMIDRIEQVFIEQVARGK